MKTRTTIYIDRKLLKEAQSAMKEKDRSLSSFLSEIIKKVVTKDKEKID